MDVKKFYFGEFVEYGKHKSSYFNLPAGLVVLIAYLLPGILGMIHIDLAAYASLSMVVVAVFERSSNMVKFYCLQFCFLAMISNILLTILSIVAHWVPIVQLIGSMISLVLLMIIVFSYFYSIIRAFQYKGWKIPWLGTFILVGIMKVED